MPLVSLPPLHDGRSNRREVFKLVNEIRGQVNLLPNAFQSALITSATGTFSAIWGSVVAENTAVKLTASVLGATADLSQACAYTIECAVLNAGGVLAIVGGTSQVTFSRETVAGTDATFATTGTTIQLEVQDAGVMTTYWLATVYAEQLG